MRDAVFIGARTRERGPRKTISCPSGAVRIQPGGSIQAAINANPARTRFCLLAGTHSLSTPLQPKRGQRFIGRYGAVLSGTGGARHAFSGSTVANVRIRNLTIERFGSPIQTAAVDFRDTRGWKLWDNLIRRNGATGFIAGSFADVARNIVRRNAQQGGGGGYDSSVIRNNEIAYNNPKQQVDWGFSAGGFKSCYTRHLVLRRNWVHHNHGPGLWLDCSNHGTARRPLVYEYNLVEDNAAMGIFHEITDGVTVIRGNKVRRNGFHPSACSWGYGAGIMISTSSNVKVLSNVVRNNCRGITLVAQNRGAAKLRNNLVRRNTIIMRDDQWSGVAQDCSCGAYSGENRFRRNVYRVTDPAGRWWGWADAAQTWAGWNASGQDTLGKLRSL